VILEDSSVDKETAAKITTRIESCMRLLGEIVQIADGNCSESEKKVIRRGVGSVLSEMQDRISDPIYRSYSELIPKDVDYTPLEGPTISDLACALEMHHAGKTNNHGS
jgi:hypothetical protein